MMSDILYKMLFIYFYFITFVSFEFILANSIIGLQYQRKTEDLFHHNNNLRFRRDLSDPTKVNDKLTQPPPVSVKEIENGQPGQPSSKTEKPPPPPHHGTVFLPTVAPLVKKTSPKPTIASEADDGSSTLGNGDHKGNGRFDEKAIQRAFMVFGALGTLILVYLAIKFVCLKKNKVAKRYDKIEPSEMDLLENMEYLDEDDDDNEEEVDDDDTLFDLHSHRKITKTNFQPIPQ